MLAIGNPLEKYSKVTKSWSDQLAVYKHEAYPTCLNTWSYFLDGNSNAKVEGFPPRPIRDLFDFPDNNFD